MKTNVEQEAAAMQHVPQNTTGETLEAKRKLAEKLLAERAAQARTYPLSFAQERLWVIDRLAPGTAGYNVPMAVYLRGQLDCNALQASLDRLVARHAALRTTFRMVEGVPRQMIHPESTVRIERIDLSAQPLEEAKAEARELASTEAATPFDLEEGPLLRVKLMVLDPAEFLLTISMHHIISDGWSMRVFAQEFTELYRAEREQTPAQLPPLPISYADFAVWQRKWLSGAVLERQMAYWRDQLAGIEPLELPCDHPRPQVQDFSGAVCRQAFGPALTAKLKALSTRTGNTLFMTLLAAFDILLHRYTGQTDLAVGTGIANRNRKEIEGLIGFFVNTLVMRTDLSDDPTFPALAARVRKTALGAYEHQDLPFEKLVEEFQPERDVSRNPLVQVMFVVQNTPSWEMAFQSTEAQLLDVGPPTANFDMEIHICEEEDELHCLLNYSTALFDPPTIERFLGHWTCLLEDVAADPDRPISAFCIVTPEEQAVLAQWELGPPLNYDASLTTPGLVAKQAAAHPRALAIASAGASWRYAELDARANRLANHLQAQGIGRGAVVAILMDRSPAFAAAALGVMKAGAAYLPIDPAYPAARAAYMLDDARAALVVTEPAHAAALQDSPVPGLALDMAWSALAGTSADAPNVALALHDRAYVIYTSGSTGRPKGVEVSHGALLNLVHWHRQAFGVGKADRATQVASPAFDAAVWELWPGLTAGASIHIPENALRAGGGPLRDWLVAQRITLSFAPTPVAEGLVELAWPRKAKLRFLLTGGDFLHKHPPGGLPFELVNNYGPTENTVVATSGTVPAGGSGVPSIGRPIANNRVCLLDAAGHPAPVGVPGELCIAGASLANGYLHHPEWTAERFRGEPAESGANNRMYHTGDLSRWRPDGEIEFVGRFDDQVKVRGHRIELGEIEAALTGHPEVASAAVAAHDAPAGGKQLVGYFVSANGPVDEAALRQYLQERIPPFMVPAVLVALEELPLTPHGKVDRRSLAAFRVSGRTEEGAAPATQTERQLALLWSSVLGRPIGNRDANFFDLGGHSLLSIRLLSAAQEHFGVALPPTTLFYAPTPRLMAQQIEAARANPAGRQVLNPLDAPYAPVMPLRESGSRPPLFLLPPASGVAFPYMRLANLITQDQPIYALQDPRLLDPRLHIETLEDLAAHYVRVIQSILPKGPYRIAGWSFGGLAAYETARQLDASGQEVAFLGLLDSVPIKRPRETGWKRVSLIAQSSLKGFMYLAFLGYAAPFVQQGVALLAQNFIQRLRGDRQGGASSSQRMLLLPFRIFWRVFRVMRANVREGAGYEPGPYSSAATLFSTDGAEDGADAALWAPHVAGRIQVRTISGGHATMMKPPHIDRLAEAVEAALQDVEIAGGRSDQSGRSR